MRRSLTTRSGTVNGRFCTTYEYEGAEYDVCDSALNAMLVNELFADGVNDITRYLRKRNSGTRQALAVDFTSAFAGTSSWKGRYAVPYESVHTSEEGLMFQDAYHEVFQLYKANHVAKAEGYDFPHEVGIVGDVSEGLHRELVVMGPVTLVGPLYFA